MTRLGHYLLVLVSFAAVLLIHVHGRFETEESAATLAVSEYSLE